MTDIDDTEQWWFHTNAILPANFLNASFRLTGRSTSPPCWMWGGWHDRRSGRRSLTLSKTSNAAAPSSHGSALSLPTSPSRRRCTASAWVSCASPWPCPTGSRSTGHGAGTGRAPGMPHLKQLRQQETQTSFIEKSRSLMTCTWTFDTKQCYQSPKKNLTSGTAGIVHARWHISIFTLENLKEILRFVKSVFCSWCWSLHVEKKTKKNSLCCTLLLFILL